MPGGKTKAQLNAEIAGLNSRLSQLTVTSAKKKKKKKKKTKASLTGVGNIPAAYSKPLGGHPNFLGGTEGSLRFKHTEFLTKLTVPKASTEKITSVNFGPGNSGAAVLDSIAKSFDRWAAHRLVLHYRPSVGTTRDGVALIGIDWDPSDTKPTTESQVASFYPNGRQPVWASFDISLAIDRIMMSRRWLYTMGTNGVDKAAFAIHVFVSTTKTTDDLVLGELWASYDLELQGPTSLNS